MRKLRLWANGRYHGHWDPRFLDHGRGRTEIPGKRLADAARHVDIPGMFIRSTESELVRNANTAELQALIRHAEVVTVTGARHMVAGANNETFGDAVARFLDRLA